MRQFTLLLMLLLLIGCSPGPKSDGPVGPPTRPGTPSSVYKAIEPSLLVYDDEDLAAAGRVAHVTMRQGQGLLSYARPLWGDREEDRPKIAHILRLIRLAKLAESPEGTREGLNDPPEMLMTVQYPDGRLVQVGFAYRRLGTGEYQSIQGRMYIPGMGEVISPELDQFYRGVATVRRVDLLVPVSVLDIEPRKAHPGSAVTVQGNGWVGVDRLSILLVSAGTKQQQLLGEVPVDRGAFTWQGSLPKDVKPGPRWEYGIALKVDGTQVYQTNVEIAAP